MKRFTAILVLITLVCNYTGVQLCVDFCCDSIESIHFGEEEAEAFCHIDDCGSVPESDCCDSEQFQVEQQLLDYTVNELEQIKTPFVYIHNQINPFTRITFESDTPCKTIDSRPLVPVPIRELTQVSLC